MANRQPDICVGIDFGTTYTGVSWYAPNERSNQINIISRWPGEAESEEKVPTVLAREGSGGETRWGFLCKGLAEEKKWKLFKLFLDCEEHEKRLTNNEHGPGVPGTKEEVQELVTLYLHQVYNHISDEIPKLIRSGTAFSRQFKHKTWDSLSIDFIFSTPTTWRAPVSQCFRGIVSQAGFGEQELHRVVLGLTEAEASAVFTAQLGMVGTVHEGDIILSIDAGGGTTDLAFVKAIDNTPGSLSLEEIRPVTGVSAGSIRIDNEFAKLIAERVKQHSETRPALPKDFSLKASQSHDFQRLKHKFGPQDCDWTGEEYFIRVATGKDSYSNEGLGIRDGRLYFTRRQLKSCFDITLQEIKGCIKKALVHFEDNNRCEGIVRHVDHVVLSGGLGSSAYVLKELTTYFKDLANETNSCVAGSEVFGTGLDARTAVIRGLLFDRGTRARALREHKARANYGIIVEEPRSKDSAVTENTRQYPADTTIFVTDQIRWLVKFGDTIQVGRPITVDITKRLEKSDHRRWTERIMWLEGRRESLPKTEKDGILRKMKEIYSVDVEVHKGSKLISGARTWRGSTAYHKCHFNLMLSVGPSGDCDVEVSENVIERSG